MADIKFSQLLPLDAGNVTKDTIFPVVENGFNWQLNTANLQPYVMNYPQGNLTANNIVGNTFTFANGVPVSNYSNANVQAYLPVYTGNLVNLQGNIITTANVQAQALSLSGNPTSITATGSITTTDNIAATNLSLSANATVVGNVQANYFLGNGFYLSGVVNSNAAYGNANVSNYLASGADSADIVTSGDVIGNNLITQGSGGNISGVNYYLGSAAQITGNISAGNVIASNFTYANGTTIINTYSNTNVSSYLNSGTFTSNIYSSTAATPYTLLNYKEAVYTIPYAATLAPAPINGAIQKVTLTGNVTINGLDPAAPAGTNIVLILTQDATGNRLLTSSMKFASGLNDLSTTPGAIDIMSIFYDGTYYYATLSLGYV